MLCAGFLHKKEWRPRNRGFCFVLNKNMATQNTGSWDTLMDWPLIGLHAVVTQDGKVFTFGTDSNGTQGGEMIYDVWDPVTNTHETLTNVTPTDIFCSAAVILPGTNMNDSDQRW